MYDERQWYQLTYLLIELLIQLLLSSSSRHQVGVTALMIAAQGGHVDTVKLLLDRGASVEEKDNVSTRNCISIYVHVCVK